ncbi:hypothetical protein [Gudongella sp. SC589]|uniref:hypothetical protein n=1 Tax=Gudongella sp. SC589 TaxID=3385990 RepID=UPI003904B1AB
MVWTYTKSLWIVRDEITTSGLTQEHYDAGDDFTLYIHGLAQETEVEVSFIILPDGGGQPEYPDSGGILNDMDMTVTGTTASDGTLTISGVVSENLPYGELRITLPDYGYYLENAIILRNTEGHHVTVGEQDN